MSNGSPSATPRHQLHTSWRGLLGAAITPVALAIIGGFAVRNVGAAPGPLVILGMGALLGVVVLFDYPHTVEFGERGITRRTALRSHLLSWERIDALERTRPSVNASLRNRANLREHPRVSGGLVARGVRRRRWLLTDRVESRNEYDALHALIVALDHPVRLRAARPHPEAAPTDLYRRGGTGEPSGAPPA